MFADVFQEFVAFLAVFLVVGFIVEFDGGDGGQVVGFADDEVEVFGADAVEGFLPLAAVAAGLGFQQVGNADFAEQAIFVTVYGLQQYAVEGAFRRGE